MFKIGDYVIYRPRHKSMGLEQKPIIAIFKRVKSDDKAVILLKKGTEYKGRREVMLKHLEAFDGNRT